MIRPVIRPSSQPLGFFWRKRGISLIRLIEIRVGDLVGISQLFSRAMIYFSFFIFAEKISHPLPSIWFPLSIQAWFLALIRMLWENFQVPWRWVNFFKHSAQWRLLGREGSFPPCWWWMAKKRFWGGGIFVFKKLSRGRVLHLLPLICWIEFIRNPRDLGPGHFFVNFILPPDMRCDVYSPCPVHSRGYSLRIVLEQEIGEMMEQSFFQEWRLGLVSTQLRTWPTALQEKVFFCASAWGSRGESQQWGRGLTVLFDFR